MAQDTFSYRTFKNSKLILSSSKKIKKANINRNQMIMCIWNLIIDVYQSFSVSYTSKSRIYNFSFSALVRVVLQTGISGKYTSPFDFLNKFLFFQPSCRKDEFYCFSQDVQSARQGLEAEEVWREEKSHKH